MQNEIIKGISKTVMDQNIITSLISNIIEENNNSFMNNIINERIKKIEENIQDIKLFYRKLEYLANDQTKFIHMRNFLKFYFYSCDPALVDINVKIIVDYILDKYNYDIYDLLLEKMCTLNKYSIEVLKDIKKLELSTDGYYTWESFTKLYNIEKKVSFSKILCTDSKNLLYTKIAFGFKSLVDGEFISNYPTLYPGSVEVSSVDNFLLTSLGIKLLSYI